MNRNIKAMSRTKNRPMNNLLFMVFLVAIFTVNAYGGDGYIFPDYHRLLSNGQAVNINLGIYQDGTLFLKFDGGEYPIHDLGAFKRGTEQAIEYTQELQQEKEGGRNSNSAPNESPPLLYTSISPQDNEKSNHFTLKFDHHSTVSQYPIKIIFFDGPLQLQSLDFPPGELQYLQKKIDILLENKGTGISKTR